MSVGRKAFQERRSADLRRETARSAHSTRYLTVGGGSFRPDAEQGFFFVAAAGPSPVPVVSAGGGTTKDAVAVTASLADSERGEEAARRRAHKAVTDLVSVLLAVEVPDVPSLPLTLKTLRLRLFLARECDEPSGAPFPPLVAQSLQSEGEVRRLVPLPEAPRSRGLGAAEPGLFGATSAARPSRGGVVACRALSAADAMMSGESLLPLPRAWVRLTGGVGGRSRVARVPWRGSSPPGEASSPMAGVRARLGLDSDPPCDGDSDGDGTWLAVGSSASDGVFLARPRSCLGGDMPSCGVEIGGTDGGDGSRGGGAVATVEESFELKELDGRPRLRLGEAADVAGDGVVATDLGAEDGRGSGLAAVWAQLVSTELAAAAVSAGTGDRVGGGGDGGDDATGAIWAELAAATVGTGAGSDIEAGDGAGDGAGAGAKTAFSGELAAATVSAAAGTDSGTGARAAVDEGSIGSHGPNGSDGSGRSGRKGLPPLSACCAPTG